jgi:drug/metabolite transporter (DMT)-like permease
MGNFLVALICLPLVYNNLIISSHEILILAFLGIFQIGISYVIFNEGIKYVSAVESMIIAMLEAIFNPFWVYLGIGEKPSNFAILGGVVIILGILAHNFFIKEKSDRNPISENI